MSRKVVRMEGMQGIRRGDTLSIGYSSHPELGERNFRVLGREGDGGLIVAPYRWWHTAARYARQRAWRLRRYIHQRPARLSPRNLSNRPGGHAYQPAPSDWDWGDHCTWFDTTPPVPPHPVMCDQPEHRHVSRSPLV